MRISVTAGRREDIIKERDAYRSEYKKQSDTHKYQMRNYKFASDYNKAQVENAIRAQVPGLNDVEIRIDNGWYDGLKVEFVSEDRGENKSLRWRWSVGLDPTGKITKESSSWSGLEATTPEQIVDLQNAVQILSSLVGMDWSSILQAGIEGEPDYYDYVSVREPKNRESEFSSQLKMAAIEDCIGAQKWIKGSNVEAENNRWARGDRWYMIHSQSDKFYTISYIADHTVQRYKGENPPEGSLSDELQRSSQYKERVKKDRLIPCIYEEVETMDMEGNITKSNPAEEPAEASTDLNGLVTL